MKKRQAELNWWAELSGWLERHQGRADYLFVYDGKQGKLDRCFDRNVMLRNVDAATVSRLYQAAAEGRLGLLRPKDMKPQLLTTDPAKMFSSGKEVYVEQMREMAAQVYAHGLNIDYFPTNLVVQDDLIYYIDYECNGYMEEWNFENWGIKYWSKTPEFLEYLQQHM